MTEISRLTCPACGGKAAVSNIEDRFTCEYCLTDFQIERKGGQVQVKPLVEAMKTLKGGVDRTASELAIKRLEIEIQILQKKLEPVTPEWNRLVRVTQSKNHNKNLMRISILILPAALILFFIGVFTDKIGLSLVAPIFFIAGIVGIIYFISKNNQYKRNTEKCTEMAKRVLPIMALIQEKKEKLQAHLKIVDADL
jgi:hypothetical protein